MAEKNQACRFWSLVCTGVPVRGVSFVIVGLNVASVGALPYSR